MKHLESKIRTVEHKLPFWKQLLFTFCITATGMLLGVFSKYLDCLSCQLPYFIEYLDLGNFFSRFAIWIFMAVCICIYSSTPVRSAINVFCFLAGMVTSYYLYSYFIAGFFPMNYAFIWVCFTLVSPILGFICWYAKGNGILSLILSSGIIFILFQSTFAYGFWYIDIVSPLEFLVFILGIIILRRTPKITFFITCCGMLAGFFFENFMHFIF